MGLRNLTFANIMLETALAEFGVDHVSLRGTLPVKFRPILAGLPALAALQLLFLHPLELELNLRTPGVIANLPLDHSLILDNISLDDAAAHRHH